MSAVTQTNHDAIANKNSWPEAVLENVSRECCSHSLSHRPGNSRSPHITIPTLSLALCVWLISRRLILQVMKSGDENLLIKNPPTALAI